MSTFSKSILVVVIAAVAAGGIYGGYKFLFSKPQISLSSTAGSSFATSKQMSQVVTNSTTTAFSLLNTDASTRVIKSATIALNSGNSTTTSYTINCATSTTNATLGSNTNYILSMAITGDSHSAFGTTTGNGLYLATTSPGITGAAGTPSTLVATTTLAVSARQVKTGEYLNCLVTTGDGYNALNSGVTGTIGFSYDAQ